MSKAPKKYAAAIDSEALSTAAHVAKWRHEFSSLRAAMDYAVWRAQGSRIGWSKNARAALGSAVRAAIRAEWK